MEGVGESQSSKLRIKKPKSKVHSRVHSVGTPGWGPEGVCIHEVSGNHKYTTLRSLPISLLHVLQVSLHVLECLHYFWNLGVDIVIIVQLVGRPPCTVEVLGSNPPTPYLSGPCSFFSFESPSSSPVPQTTSPVSDNLFSTPISCVFFQTSS